MPTVYGAGASPFVRKVRVAMAEKGIAYDLEMVIPTMTPPGYEKISPLKKIPAFRDGERTLCDSSVICAYLERTNPKPSLYPADPYEYARALWFEEYGDSALVAMTGTVFFQKVVGPAIFKRPTDEAAVKTALDSAPALFDYLEGQIQGDWLVGSTFSIADIGIGSPFVNFRHAGHSVDGKRWPRLARYVERIHARPSFQALIREEEASFGKAA